MKPLEGYIILDFTQFLAGPSAGLRLADLGAKVIKIEKPEIGDAYRSNYGPSLKINNHNAQFYFANRNKESISIDLKNEKERDKLIPLIKSADAMIINFRHNVTKKLKLDYDSIKKINPDIVYGEITGYGENSTYKDYPGQDLLLQSVTGAGYLNGSGEEPIPFGIPVADLLSGQYLVQGVLAGLYKKSVTGKGALIETSLFEAMLDIEFEAFSAFINGGKQLLKRGKVNGANVCMGAPYGMYETKEGYLALAMGSVVTLGELIGCKALTTYTNQDEWFTKQDEIKMHLRDHLLTETAQHWLEILEPADIWCAKVLNWDELMGTEGFKVLDMIQKVELYNGSKFETTRCPIKIDNEYLKNEMAAPDVGQHNKKYNI